VQPVAASSHQASRPPLRWELRGPEGYAISRSRLHLPLGDPFPAIADHTFYVWVRFCLAEGTSRPLLEPGDPAELGLAITRSCQAHVTCRKDILRLHAALLARHLCSRRAWSRPSRCLAIGFLTREGRRWVIMGNVLSISELSESYGRGRGCAGSLLRGHHLLVMTGLPAARFPRSEFNNDLGQTIGNLLNRTTSCAAPLV